MILYSALYDENILHFIGQWHLATEDARLRDALEAFRRLQEDQGDPGDILALSVGPHQFLRIPEYIPHIPYHPQQWDPQGDARHLPRPSTPDKPLIEPADPHLMQDARLLFGWGGPGHMVPPALDIPAPGQVIFVVRQTATLEDNDILDLGDGRLPQFDPTIGARLLDLVDKAGEADILASLQMPHSPEDIGAIVVAAQAAIAAGDAPHLVAQADHLTGIFVNGTQVQSPVLLDDVLPPAFLPAPETNTAVVDHIERSLDDADIEGSLNLQAGANMALNAAMFSNVGLLGGVIAVAGDVYQLDAIIQSNAYSDLDTVTGQMAAGAGNATASYNFAQFIDQPMEPVRPLATSAGEADIFPSNWAVTLVEGDLIFTQWLVQTNFVYDNDVHVLRDTGAYSNFVTGANLSQNITTFSDLGLVYDLILIGGNLYDANIITQINVLFDNDVVSTGGAGGEGSAVTGGNLLYNGATISNLGAQNWLEGLPQHYLDALEGIMEGNRVMPEGFGSDSAFGGLDMLSVLVVTGSVYDLHYIRQTNVVGDTDLVAAAEAATLGGGAPSGADWGISTGQNALVNTATIVDTDSLGDIAYAGGDVYSDAILIQAEFLATEEDGPDALVTEAIAFLSADEVGEVLTADEGIAATPSDSHLSDVMSSVLT